MHEQIIIFESVDGKLLTFLVAVKKGVKMGTGVQVYFWGLWILRENNSKY